MGCRRGTALRRLTQGHYWKQDHAFSMGAARYDPYHNDLTSEDLPILKEFVQNMVDMVSLQSTASETASET